MQRLRQESRPTAWGGARCKLAMQTTAPSTQRAVRAQWAVGWLCTRRSARRPRATGLEGDGYDGSKPHPLTWCGVGTRASANGVGWSASRVGRADNRAKHAARSACSVTGRLVRHVTKRVRAARHRTRKRWLRQFEAASADLVRCRLRKASANGVGWSASQVGRADNRAKHAVRSACSVAGRLVRHVTKRARAVCHGTRTRRLRWF